jgi:hypothetical protein
MLAAALDIGLALAGRDLELDEKDDGGHGRLPWMSFIAGMIDRSAVPGQRRPAGGAIAA